MLINFNQQFRLGQMNSILLSIILLPILEIYLLIKIGSQIGALFTILLIFSTAIIGIYYAKYEGLNTLKSGFIQISKNVQKARAEQVFGTSRPPVQRTRG